MFIGQMTKSWDDKTLTMTAWLQHAHFSPLFCYKNFQKFNVLKLLVFV